MSALLQVNGLGVELEAEVGLVRALESLTLSIQRGETFALVGESGCGKSMTALALLRLLPDNGWVADGQVRLAQRGGQGAGGSRGDKGGEQAGDTDLLSLPEARMRAVRGGRIAMIFQEPSTSLNPVMRVGEQIVEAVEAHTPLRGAAARARALYWLGRVGIPEPERRLNDYPFAMSGGQKQRVMIAIALAGEPDLLVADEPTTALDVSIQAQILELLRELQRERHMGLLLITHDLAVVSGMAQRVALMYAGQIVEVAEAADFFAAPRHPYAQALLQALPGSARRGQPLAAIAGTVPALHQRFTGCRFAPRCGVALAHCHSTLPALKPVAGGLAGHEARCLLVEAGVPVVPPQPQAEAPFTQPVAPSRTQPAAPPAEEPLLSVRDLQVQFSVRGTGGGLLRRRGVFEAVRGVSFDVAPGQTLALVGESGCGKTTTGKAIVQLLRRSATTQGQALLAGQDLFTLQGAALQRARRDVQIIFQDPFASLNPRMRVAEILEEGLLALMPELDATARLGRVAGLLEQVGLPREALLRHPHEFSGGQRQRIAIARALAVQPRLIVCDEPTSALDVSVQAQILNLLRELQRSLGVSYLFITHNIGVVEYIADRVAVMNAGRIEEQGSAEEVLQGPRSDYTRRLLAAVPRLLLAV